MSIIEGIMDLNQYDFTDTSFDLLMQKRIHRVLVICSNYDNYMLEEDAGLMNKSLMNMLPLTCGILQHSFRQTMQKMLSEYYRKAILTWSSQC